MLSRFIAASLLFVTVNAAVAFSPLGKGRVLSMASESFSLTDKVKAEGKPSSWWLARAYSVSKERPQIVVCGSSQIGGLQSSDANLTGRPVDFVLNHHCPSIELALEQKLGQKPYVFLSALPGAMVSDHFAIARALYSAQGAPPLVVLTVSPRDFIDNSLPCAGSTEPYKYFAQYSDMSSYVGLAYNKPWSRFEYFISNEVPVRHLEESVKKSSNAFVSALVPCAGSIAKPAEPASGASAAEQLKFVMGGYEGNIKPGQAVLTPNLPRIFVDNSRDYKRRYKNTHPDTYDVQLAYFKTFVQYLRTSGARVLVVGMPLTASNRDILPESFWQRYKDDLQAALKPAGAKFLDLIADPGYDNNDFCDTVHLNATGGGKLARSIASAIASDKTLAQALKPGRVIAGKASGQLQ